MSIFLCLLTICLSSLENCSDFLPIFNWIVWFFAIELYEFFIYFGYWPLIWYIICKYFLLFSRLRFHIVDGFLSCAEAFYFDIVPFIYFWFSCFCFWCQIQEIIFAVENLNITLQLAFCIHESASIESTNHKSCSTVVCTEKYLCISGHHSSNPCCSRVSCILQTCSNQQYGIGIKTGT